MAKVIDPEKEIKDYLLEQGYLPSNSNNTAEALHNAIITGAARFFNKYSDVNFTDENLCWAQKYAEAAQEGPLCAAKAAVYVIEGELDCYNNTSKNTTKLIVEKSLSLPDATT